MYHELYKHLPENTISEKIIKLRYINSLERKELAKLLGLHIDTLNSWEWYNVYPSPANIKKLCDIFNVDLLYFHEYYDLYFSNPEIKIREWKDKNNITYKQATQLLDITHSGFGRLVNGKIKLSYDMYLKLKEIGAF